MQGYRSLLALGIILIAVLTIWGPQTAWAVPNPDGIRWKASPTAFVDSLYRCVLGRAPESRAVVQGWARQVTSQPGSRRTVFWRFIHSQEYKKSRWARLSKVYNVYRKNQLKSRYWEYYAAKRPSGGIHLEGPYAFGVAMALVGYHRAFYPRW
jgi:hypothetical protein